MHVRFGLAQRLRCCPSRDRTSSNELAPSQPTCKRDPIPAKSHCSAESLCAEGREGAIQHPEDSSSPSTWRGRERLGWPLPGPLSSQKKSICLKSEKQRAQRRGEGPPGAGQGLPSMHRGFLANFSLPRQPLYRQQHPAAQILKANSAPKTKIANVSCEGEACRDTMNRAAGPACPGTAFPSLPLLWPWREGPGVDLPAAQFLSLLG